MSPKRRKISPWLLVIAAVLGAVTAGTFAPTQRRGEDPILVLMVTPRSHCYDLKGRSCLKTLERWINSQRTVDMESIAPWAGAVLDLANVCDEAVATLSVCSNNAEVRRDSRSLLERALAVGDRLSALPVDSALPEVNVRFTDTWAGIRADYERVMKAPCPGEASV